MALFLAFAVIFLAPSADVFAANHDGNAAWHGAQFAQLVGDGLGVLEQRGDTYGGAVGFELDIKRKLHVIACRSVSHVTTSRFNPYPFVVWKLPHPLPNFAAQVNPWR